MIPYLSKLNELGIKVNSFTCDSELDCNKLLYTLFAAIDDCESDSFVIAHEDENGTPKLMNSRHDFVGENYKTVQIIPPSMYFKFRRFLRFYGPNEL